MTETSELPASPNGYGAQSLWDSTRVAAGSALRTMPFWLLAGVLAFVAVGRLTTGQTASPVATAELGLTESVVWPFYEVVLSEAYAAAVEAQAAVEQELGDALVSYEVRRPQSIGLVEIQVTASSASQAQRGLETATDAVVAADLDRLTGRLAEEADALQTAEATATEELNAVVTKIDSVTQQFDPDQERSERLALEQELELLEAERRSIQNTQLRAREQLAELEIEVNTAATRIDVSSVTSQESSSRSLQLAAAVGTAIAAALALSVLSREQGRIQNPAHVRSVMGLPTLRFPDTPTTAVALARLLQALREESGARIVGIAAIPSGADSAHELSLALKSIGEDVLVTEFGFESDERTGLAFCVLDPFDETTIDAQMACDSVIVVAREKATRMWKLRNKIQQLEDRGLPVQGVLLRRVD
ncbi:MAG: hypothetical protein ACN4GZ_16760 [Acidimicrobiales bacterium]